MFILVACLNCEQVSARAPQGHIVAIDNSVFVAMLDESIEDCVCMQEKDNWCWAACIEMILEYYGIYESQSDIVSYVYGYPFDRTASGNLIAEAFDGWSDFSVRSFNSKTAQSFINEIAAGHPLIIGWDEHAYLLTHIFYKKNVAGALSPYKIVMINPSTGDEEVRDWSDFFSSLNTIVSFYL